MKFVQLNLRGGNYMVVAENVAWLRTAENGQTQIGIIGGQPLLWREAWRKQRRRCRQAKESFGEFKEN